MPKPSECNTTPNESDWRRCCASTLSPSTRYFYRAEDYHQDYLDKNPDGYCHLPAALFEFAKNFRAGGNNE